MRVKPIVAKKGEAPRHMVCAVTGKDVQSGATVVSLNEKYWCYVNPRRELTEERRAELLASVKELPQAVALKKTEGDK
jgi:hypothetical protein